MTRAKRNTLILIAGIAAIIVMIILILLPGRRPIIPVKKGAKPEAVLPSAPTVPAAELSPEEKKAVVAKQNLELEARRMAQIFIERYGSFTNQGNFENIVDLYPLMTANMRRVSSSYTSEQKLAHSVDAYYGITTKTLSVETISQKDNKALVNVRLQKEEIIGSGYNPSISYATAKVSLVRLGDVWKVDDVNFEE